MCCRSCVLSKHVVCGKCAGFVGRVQFPAAKLKFLPEIWFKIWFKMFGHFA